MANHIDVVEILLNNGANIEKADRDGYRPLMLAANTFVSTQILSLLIDRGADKNARNRVSFLTLRLP
jgi:ankyrin repeat protein